MFKASEVSHFTLQMPQLRSAHCSRGGPGAVPTTAKDRPWLMNSLAGAGCTVASCPRRAGTAHSSAQPLPGSAGK